MREKPKIYLYDTCGIGIIILSPSGVLYVTQTGGDATTTSSEEGVYVPLWNAAVDQEDLLIKYFTGPKWNGLCGYGIDEETADYVDQVMTLNPGTEFIKVDRAKLSFSHEAWIYVKVTEPKDQVPIIRGFGICEGILTWANSE